MINTGWCMPALCFLLSLLHNQHGPLPSVTLLAQKSNHVGL